MKDNRTFLAYWGEGYGGDQTATVGVEYFTPARGYGADELNAILELDPLQVADLSDLSGAHVIIRII